MSEANKILPLFLNTDSSYEKLKPYESPLIKGFTWDINANPNLGLGTDNPSGEGQNMLSLTPVRSNQVVPEVLLPDGINKCIGEFESVVTQEFYHVNYNYKSGLHGIYVLDGNTGVWQKVIEDAEFLFTDAAENFLADHRFRLRIVRDKDQNITEKHLLITNGQSWQKWINVIAAIGSNGFDAVAFPYWKLQPPHFDRRELLEWAPRPCMTRPVITRVPNAPSDLGKPNRLIDKAFQIAVARQSTDGRVSTLSPYSLPLIVKSEQFLNSPDSVPKNARVTIDAGSPLTEKLLIFVRRAGERNTLDSIGVWGDWYLYDVISKFQEAATGDYWLRQNPWADFSYDSNFNTIEYTFDNSKVGRIVSQADTIMLQTGMPQVSVALTDLKDAALLSDNRYDYNNFSKDLISKLDAVVKEKPPTVCSKPLRKLRVYAYVGMCDVTFLYTSQVGYFNGTDTQMRFGGIREASIFGAQARLDVNESKFFGLDFADKDAFRLYLKGTPYFADGTWIQVNSDNSKVEITDLLDASSADVLEYIQKVYREGGYFACQFDLTVPSDRYIATIGRHSVASDGDYRAQSTYIYGIANSRVKSVSPASDGNGFYNITTLKPNSIVDFSKEMELDLTVGDVDTWGNNHDLFYIYCPYNHSASGAGNFRFIEGYLQEDRDTPLPVELYPYQMTQAAADDWGKLTDKNGFYWGYTKKNNSTAIDIQVSAKINCAYPTSFNIATSQTGTGWKQNKVAYVSDNNSGVFGACNRVIFRGSVKSLDGSQGYSNIAINLKDGATVYTGADGSFTIIAHNGQPNPRLSNVFVNAGGTFIVTLAACAQIPLTSFNEALVPCVNCTERVYPISLNLNVLIQSSGELSLKQGGEYAVGIAGADLAGRLQYVNVIKNVSVSSFLERDNMNATYLQLLITGALQIAQANPDIKWVSPYVSKNTAAKRYVEWVGDKIVYLDSNGNEVADAASAFFCSIKITSLYNHNITNNFSLLATYEFQKEDRLRVLDDGDGNLLDVATFGDPIDLQVLGTNYNQAAINAGLQLPQSNTVLDNQTTQAAKEISVIVRYDARLDKLIDKTGFWIEIYTPTQASDLIPFFEMPGFYPVINGEIAVFDGYNNGVPTYQFPVSIDLEFWDTYYLERSIAIPEVGNKFFAHPFESPNITDNWGASVTSGGRIHIKNDDARQRWFGGDVIRSDAFVKEGLLNGLATFRGENRKDYGTYPYGDIVATHTKRNIVAFICTNDWFVARYDMPYSRVDDRGMVVITNLNDNLSAPDQKQGSVFGLNKEHTRTVIIDNDFFFWLDAKNTGFIKCNYSSATDVTQEGEGERGGLQAYLNQKLWYISKWNNEHARSRSWDVVAGIDAERGNIYLTFRNRRGNTNEDYSYVNNRRNLDITFQETFVYNIQYASWIRLENFTPEAYGKVRGRWANVEFLTFAAGKPYFHNNTPNNSFLNFFGVQTIPSVIGVFNKDAASVNVLKNISIDVVAGKLWVDMVYPAGEQNAFSYIPLNLMRKKENQYYAAALRNMVSYLSPAAADAFRSTLRDGKRLFGNYFIARFVGDLSDQGKYVQASGLYYETMKSPVNKKAPSG